MSLPTGTPAPRFSLRDQHGAQVEVGGKAEDGRATLLVFYPFAFSGVCGSELAALRDAGGEFDGERVRLVAVSCDPMFTLRAFAEADGLTFPLLSDFWPHGATAEAYGVLDRSAGFARRSTYIVDKQGIVRWAVHNETPEARDLEAQAQVLSGLAGEGAADQASW